MVLTNIVPREEGLVLTVGSLELVVIPLPLAVTEPDDLLEFPSIVPDILFLNNEY